ncbi:hypothetical protein [Candidatus Poriferisodalis sp.]|uniref:hypothetical protein n=1 Tax=Candidatus Poriferisodalis sp. TaxID=3101277 RepID=UPI003B5AED3B
MPWLERADADGDGAEELGVGWNSLAGEAGAAESSGTAGLSCPEGMVLAGGLCKTPKVEHTEMERVCPQADDGYVLVTTLGELGPSHTCQKTVPAYCTGGKVLHQGQCRVRTVSTSTLTATATWSCVRGTLVSTSGEHGTAWSCKIAAGTTCPSGQRYRSGRCEKQVTTYGFANYRYECPSGYTLGYDGIGWTCSKSVTPYCTGSHEYRTSPTRGCYRSESSYATAEYEYSCPSGYTASGSGASTKCSKTETYKKRVCSYDPFAGQQCWWETRTRTVTAAPVKSCERGFSPHGSKCRSDTASTRWVKTTRQPVTKHTQPATRACPSGFSPHGSRCRSATTEWKPSGSTPVTSYRYESADRSCRSGYDWDAAAQLCTKTVTTTVYSDPTPPLTTLTGRPPIQRCPQGWDPAGGGRCSRSTLGPPTQAPTRTVCSESLGSLGEETVTRSGTLAAGCVSWNKGNAQSPHWARHYTLSVPVDSKIDAGASSAAADMFVQVMSGTGPTATVIASDDDSGANTDAQIDNAAVAAGTEYTIEVTTPTANITGAFTLTVAVTPDLPPVKIIGLDDSYGIGQAQAAAGDGFTVEPADASCTVSPTDAKITVGNGADRTVSLTRKPPFSQHVTVKCTATGRSEGTATATLRGHLAIASLTISGNECKKAAADSAADYACTVPYGSALTVTGAAQGPHNGLSLSWAATSDAKIDSHTQAKTQVAAPSATPVVYSRSGTAAVSCTADSTVTLTATAGAHSRSVTVAIACGQPPPAAACDDPLGTLAEGTVTRSGTIAADSKCTTANRGRSGTYYTRRHTLTLSGPAQVTVDVGNDPANTARLDTYMVLLDGHGATGSVNASDDDDGPGNDSRISKKLPAGDYTIEATTYRSAAAGRYRLKINTAYDKTVKITGLADTASDGTGEVAVTAPFTVEPANAACTASPATASVADGTDATDRILTAGITAPGSLAVTVTCTAAGHAAATQTVTLTASLAAGVTTVGARAVVGGECKTLAPAPDGADVAYECTMAQGGSFDVEAEATATGTALTVAWTATGGIAEDSQSQGTVTAVPGPDSTTLHRRTATATLSCTTNGTASATATLGDSTKTARLTVACQTPVEITGLADAGETGSGKVAVTADFTVEPAEARCSASPGTAAVTAGQSAAERTLTAKIAAPGSLAVTVTCEADGRAAASQTVTLTAAEEPVSPCVSALGVLEPGAVSVSGQTSADGGCLSKNRGPVRGRRYFAHRHTLTLQEPTWVTVELVGGKRTNGSGSFDTYLRLIDGHSADGAGRVRASSDDIGDENGSYRRDSRVEAGRLPAGKYTLEASASAYDDTGAYRLDISAVTVHGLSSSLHAPHGQTTEFVFEYRPANAEVAMAGDVGADVTVSAAAGSGVLKVTPDRPGSYLAVVAITPKTPTATQPQSASAAADAQAGDADPQPAGPGAAPTVNVVPAGKACAAGQTVIVVIGRAVCTGPATAQVTIRTPATGSRPAKVMPAACITRLSVGRWYLDTEAWPVSTDCNAAVNNVKDSIRRRTRFYTFEITHSSVDVTIRLSSDNRNTHLALYRAITDPISGLLTNLGSAPVAINNDAWDTAAGTGYLYLDGNATDSRIRTTLTKGVYVISAASLTMPDAADQHTINIKIPHPPSADDD